jgi:23S rRNA (adenine2030-N6)-methyltransferase
MLSYQHLYHAGNLVDAHKHSLLAWMLDYLTQKDKPLSYLETHAGRALYDLDATEAFKTGEATEGIRRVLAARWFAENHPYRRILNKTCDVHGPQSYPGSPMLAAEMLRPNDRLHLSALHPQEYTGLDFAMSPYGAQCYAQDGFAMAQSLCPPTPRRGLTLIDPSYEIKSEYQNLPGFLRQITRKWPVGVFVLWYPLLTSGAHKPMLADLKQS